MIEIKEKKDCCGCGACVQRCPKSCISMIVDKEGFGYPVVAKDLCIECGLCEKVCPVINQAEQRVPLEVYAAKHKEESVRLDSSSGGVFTAIAACVIDEGGVVFGAKFDKDWSVVHGYAETEEGVSDFRGSKYVQSKIGDSYNNAERFLKAGRKVLFSGTPCQIAGLKRFLRKEYDNLLTVDFICHGVPSPGVWREYLKYEIAHQKAIYQIKDIPIIEDISFRNKQLGWSKYCFTMTWSGVDEYGINKIYSLSETRNKNIFLRGFLADLYLRPSCYACPAKCLKSGSDMTIGDFWGIQKVLPQIDDDKGMNVVMLNNAKMMPYFAIGIEKWPVAYDVVLKYNTAILASAKETNKREYFFQNKEQPFNKVVLKLSKVSLLRRVKSKIVCMLKK